MAVSMRYSQLSRTDRRTVTLRDAYDAGAGLNFVTPNTHQLLGILSFIINTANLSSYFIITCDHFEARSENELQRLLCIFCMFIQDYNLKFSDKKSEAVVFSNIW